MRREYRNDCCITICTICNHAHIEYYDGTLDVNEPFVELCESVIYEKEYKRINRLTQYVCPSCGTIQVNINDL